MWFSGGKGEFVLLYFLVVMLCGTYGNHQAIVLFQLFHQQFYVRLLFCFPGQKLLSFSEGKKFLTFWFYIDPWFCLFKTVYKQNLTVTLYCRPLPTLPDLTLSEKTVTRGAAKLCEQINCVLSIAQEFAHGRYNKLFVKVISYSFGKDLGDHFFYLPGIFMLRFCFSMGLLSRMCFWCLD